MNFKEGVTMLKKFFAVLVVFILLTIVSSTVYSYTVVSGDVSGQTWSAGTYFVTGNITVSDNTTLTIDAGAVVKFATYIQFTVYGTLDANGTETSKIVFTSKNDDTYGETITGSNGNPSNGDWYGIFLDGQSASGIGKFSWCIIRYGGYGYYGYYGNVNFYYSDSGHFINSISEYSGQH
ncbi:MAG: hypothetical protein QG641_1632, partial [Candidatus Poribacteria bacterium]|nr:hypothetical protein [Candidatus Poribacteria bacterium]